MPKNLSLTKADLDHIESRTERVEYKVERIETKLDKIDKKLDKLAETLDGFVGVVDDLRTENIVGANQFRDHEKRISKLEKTAAQV